MRKQGACVNLNYARSSASLRRSVHTAEIEMSVLTERNAIGPLHAVAPIGYYFEPGHGCLGCLRDASIGARCAWGRVRKRTCSLGLDPIRALDCFWDDRRRVGAASRVRRLVPKPNARKHWTCARVFVRQRGRWLYAVE